jgi:hypothetical protein
MLLSSPGQALAIGQRAQTLVRREQGATEQHAQIIMDLLRNSPRQSNTSTNELKETISSEAAPR